MKELVIFGTGEFAEVAHFYFTRDSDYRVKAFTVNSEKIQSSTFCKLPTVPFEQLERNFPPSKFELFIGIAYKGMNSLRAEKYFLAKNRGYQLASYYSSKINTFEKPLIGQNCFFLEDNTLQPFTRFGNNVILWSGNHIGHHCVIEDHCFITSHVCIGGGATIGEYSFIGMNATIRDHIKVASHSLIGAGTTIMEDTVEMGVYSQAGTRSRSIFSDEVSL